MSNQIHILMKGRRMFLFKILVVEQHLTFVGIWDIQHNLKMYNKHKLERGNHLLQHSFNFALKIYHFTHLSQWVENLANEDIRKAHTCIPEERMSKTMMWLTLGMGHPLVEFTHFKTRSLASASWGVGYPCAMVDLALGHTSVSWRLWFFLK